MTVNFFFRLLVIKGGGSARYTRETTVGSWPSIVSCILEISGAGILEWTSQWPVVNWGNESVYRHVQSWHCNHSAAIGYGPKV